MRIEGDVARRSAVLGPVIGAVEQLQAGDRRRALDTIDKFLDGVGGGSLEEGYKLWREGLSPGIAKTMTDLIRKDPWNEKTVRSIYLNSQLDQMMGIRPVAEKPSTDQ